MVPSSKRRPGCSRRATSITASDRVDAERVQADAVQVGGNPAGAAAAASVGDTAIPEHDWPNVRACTRVLRQDCHTAGQTGDIGVIGVDLLG